MEKQQRFGFVNPIEWLAAIRQTARTRKTMLSSQRNALAIFRKRIAEITLEAAHAAAQLLLFPSQVGKAPNPFAEVAKELIAWSDAQVVAFHDGILKDALEKLRDTTASSTRKELFLWFAPDAHHEVAFSFESCCNIAGLDADTIRRQVLRIYRGEILALIEAEDRATVAEGRRIVQAALV